MNSIVIAFPKKEAGLNIRKILVQSGYNVVGVYTTGAQVLAGMSELDNGVLICGSRFVDMMYTELYDYLPKGFEMLLIASHATVMEKEIGNLVSLAMPFKVHELLQTLEMMDERASRLRRKKRKMPKGRSQEEEELLRKAKALLMERNHLSEEEAHQYVQKRSMESGTGLVEVAQMIISLMEDV